MSYASRLTEVDTLQRAGKGLIAIAPADDEVVIVKDPVPDTDCGSSVVVAWKRFVPGTAATYFGV